MKKHKGMFLEVDLDYPINIHKYHSDFPLAPERYDVDFKELSPLCEKIYSFSNINKFKKENVSETKLIPNLHNNKKYILHIKNVIYYLSLSMKLKKIHRIVSFDQKPFLKEYIKKLTNLRA